MGDRISRLVDVLERAHITTIWIDGEVHIVGRAWFVALAIELLEALDEEAADAEP